MGSAPLSMRPHQATVFWLAFELNGVQYRELFLRAPKRQIGFMTHAESMYEPSYGAVVVWCEVEGICLSVTSF